MSPSSRSVRADAARNRQRLLDAATRVFTEQGPEAPFIEIARVAGVGVGTVYRHFPNRAVLIEAAYRQEVDALSAAAVRLAGELAPRAALRAWMDLFSGYLGVKSGLIDSLRVAEAEGADPFATSRDRNIASLEVILTAEPDAMPLLSAEELLLMLGGAILTTDSADLAGQRARMLDFLADAVWGGPESGGSGG